MPELPEVETTKTSLAPLIGQEVTAVDIYQPKLRWPMPDDLHTLIGYRLIATTRRAKYLILHFAPSIPLPPSSGDNKVNKNKSLLIHLGMSGSLQQYPAGQPIRKHDHLIVTFASGIDKTDSSNQSNDKNKDNNRAASSKLKNPSSTLLTQLHYHDPRRFGAVLWLEDYEEKLLNHLGVEPLSETFNGQYLF
ncbi:MAG: DNA-formamidopyrimidine glycosylase family protein, partial [Psychrobacter sp.]|nr:DNA-formamidopyrimidine glycosylase family protein [Psychrobacter sp.]